MKKGTTKKPVKGKMSKRSNSTIRVSTNLGILPSGMYRARKMINGLCYTQNFSNKKKANLWLNSL